MIGKVLDASGNGYYDDFIKCMTDAVDKGANIVNLSLGVRSKNRKTGTFRDLTSKQGTSAYNPLEQALSYAAAHGKNFRKKQELSKLTLILKAFW
jgi:hypothetical protein